MQTVRRLLEVLSYILSAPSSFGVNEVSKQLSMSKSTVSRVLSALKGAQWLIQDPNTQRYSLGPKFIDLVIDMLSKLEIRSASQPCLQELHNMTKETVILSLKVGCENVIVDQLTPSHDYLYLLPLGARMPLWIGATGKSILAFTLDGEIEVALADLRKSGRRTYDSGEPINIEVIRQQLEKTRKEGFSIAVGERVAAAIAVASPIFGSGHQVIGSLAIVAPLFRLSEDLAARYGPLVRQLAINISLRMGDVESNV